MSDNLEELKTKGHFKIDWGRQGGVILAYLIIFFGYYGLIVNIIMVYMVGDEFRWISFTELDRTIFFWTYKVFIETYFLPVLLLFAVCFFLTYKEDIPQYGIRASIWLVPFIISQGFIFYFIMFGFSAEPFILQFTYGEGYLNILILYGITISGAVSGMKIKQFITLKQKV